jgi:hypothetical protein
MNIAASTSNTIEDLKRHILEKSMQKGAEPQHAIPICEENRQRVIFMGQELQNAQVRLSEVSFLLWEILQINANILFFAVQCYHIFN